MNELASYRKAIKSTKVKSKPKSREDQDAAPAGRLQHLVEPVLMCINCSSAAYDETSFVQSALVKPTCGAVAALGDAR